MFSLLRTFGLLSSWSLPVLAARAQEVAPGAPAAPVATAPDVDPINEERVRELVTWIASDERGGRDTPSRGLEATAVWLTERFAAAGLEPAAPDEWRHRYELPGQRLDSRTLELTVEIAEGETRRRQVLAGDVDVRLLAAGEAATGTDPDANFVGATDPRLDGLLARGGARRATLLEVGEDHPFWTAAAGVREMLSSRLRGSAPVFLVRRGVLPTTATAAVSWSVEWKGAAAEAVPIALANVVGVLRGSSLPDEYVLLSAHYDHIGVRRPVDGDAICNGADDDASGTTAVVLLAEALVRRPRPARSIAFVCFSAEEKGLRGSAAFAERPPFPLDRVVANLNIEMIGRPESGRERAAWITGADYSDFAAIAAPALQRAGIELVEFELATQLFAQSDNLSLARKGVVAHSLSAGSLHADYHQPGDEVGKLDLPHMTAVIRGLAEVALEFANRDGRPTYNEAGRAFLAAPRRR